ncbi:hypothetical protein [uncultured Arthrobacter sp.]|uniref:hypothetical protein n=1 Tax=uncultured Arthrobacter sp. TaxID=114050 RepID=UPI0032171D8B
MARYRTKNMDDTPLRPAAPDAHWKSLQRGDRVSVRLAPGYEAAGRVDAVTADHTAVWVDLDGGRGRTLLHCSDGVEIFPHTT